MQNYLLIFQIKVRVHESDQYYGSNREWSHEVQVTCEPADLQYEISKEKSRCDGIGRSFFISKGLQGVVDVSLVQVVNI